MDQFFTVFITVFSLLMLAVPGFILTKAKLLNKSIESALSVIVLYAAQPVMVFMSFQKQFRSDILTNIPIVAGLSLVIHLIMVGLMALVLKRKSDDAKVKTIKFASIFSNCGYMGLPFLKALFGSNDVVVAEILIYAAVVIGVFNLIMWSIGVYIMTGDKKMMSPKKALLNPTMIGTFLGLIIFLTVKTPFAELATGALGDFIKRVVDSLNVIGDLVTPLSMLLLGVKLANIRTKALFVNKGAYISSFFKLIVMGVISMLVVAFLPVSNVIKYAIVFLLSMPSAAATVLFSVQFGGDGEQATSNLLLSTILSLITIPLIYVVFQNLFGIPPIIA